MNLQPHWEEMIVISSQRISPNGSAISLPRSALRFYLLHLFGLLMAGALIFPTTVSVAASTPPAPCPAVAHPHLDPHVRVPVASRTVVPAQRHAEFGPDGGGDAAVRQARSCVQKAVYRWRLSRQARD